MNKKTLYKIHKYSGLTVGFILFIMAISGVIINYRDELLPMVYSDLMQVEAKETRAPIQEQILAIKEKYPNIKVTHYYTAEEDDTSSLAFYRPEGTLLPHLVALDPYTNEVKGSMPLTHNIFGLMIYVHANLLAGKVGGWIVGFSGILLTFFFISGLTIWWPKNGFIEKIKTLPRNGARGLHRGIGIFLGLPLVFSGITGTMIAFDLMQPIGRMMGDKAKPEEMVLVQECTQEEEFNALSVLNTDQMKNLVSIHFCSKKNGLMKISFGHDERSGHHGFIRLVVNPKNNEVLQTFDSNIDPASWNANALTVYPLHTGAYFGGLGRILILICGIGLAILYITGLMPTLKKKLQKK